MKKSILFLLPLLLMSCSSINTIGESKWYEKDSRIEVVNETTIIFKSVDKIEIKSNTDNLITYVYDLYYSKLMKVARGSFSVNLTKGDYIIQSNKPITKTAYKVIIE